MARTPGKISGAPDSSAQSRSHLPSRDTGITHNRYSRFSVPRPTAHYLLPLCSLRLAKGEPADLSGSLLGFAGSQSASASPPESLGQRPRDSGRLNSNSCYPKLCSKKQSCLEESGHWAKNFHSQGWTGPPRRYQKAFQGPHLQAGCFLQRPPKTEASVQEDPWTFRNSAQKEKTLLTHLTDEETEAQRREVICRRSHSAKGALKTDRLTPLPPISPLHCEPLAPALNQGRPLKSTLTPRCCKPSANPMALEMGDRKAVQRGREGGATRQWLLLQSDHFLRVKGL